MFNNIHYVATNQLYKMFDMVTNNKLISTSKFLSLVLRHRPEVIGAKLDPEGWLSIDLEQKTPPETLYHGTVAVFLDGIRATGLQKRSRHHVHLSPDEETATKVGSRRGKPIILRVAAETMHRDGHQFYLSANGVWLVDAVPVSYLTFPG